MTLTARFMSFFPLLHSALIFFSLGLFYYGLIPGMFGLIFSIYIFPLAAFHVHQFFYPVRPGKFDLTAPRYVPWWGAYQIQLVFYTLPFLEGVLRLVPGLYSYWLRLWGAKIGSGIFWPPNIEISDRSLMEIGDFVVFGYQTKCFGHIVRRLPSGKITLFVGQVKIGAQSFIGAGSSIAPGAEIGDKVHLSVLSHVYPSVSIPAGRKGLDREIFKGV